MRSASTRGALALCTLLPLSVQAQPLEEVIVTSSRVPMPAREIGTSVSVINAAEIRSLGFNSLQDILRTQPSVAVSNNGGAGKISSLRIRGEEGYRTRVLIDGIDVSDTTAPQFGPRVEQLLSSGIQRVEILRGPQGLMYGADAGGIVNISTRTPGEGLRGDVSAEAGRYGTRQYSANLSGGNALVDGSLSLTDLESDGFNARLDDRDPADDDGYDNTTAHGRLGWNAGERLRLELVARDVEGDSQYDDCFNPITYGSTNSCRDEYQQQAWRGAALWRGETLNHELAWSRSDTERATFSDGLAGFATEGSLSRWSYLGSYAPNESLQLVYGAEHESAELDDGSFDTERDQTGYFLEYQGSLDQRLFFTAGARHDDNEDFGEHTTWRVSGAWVIPLQQHELKLKATRGTGFRAPSLYEIAYNRSFAFAPAADVVLQEERSAGHDLGVAFQSAGGVYLEAVWFDQDVENEIYFDLVDYSGYLQGRGDTRSRGVELIADIPLGERLSLSGNLTWNDTENAEGDDRTYRPRQLANLSLRWQSPGERLNLGLHLRAARDAQEFDGRALDDYEVLSLNARFNLLPRLELFGRLENLLDEDYQEVPGYRSSGQALYAGIRYHFQE
ncbi:TonB-dependent receptor plug domain-containing protein [Haliea atlantica]